MKISEVNIQLIKPTNGLVVFASVVLDGKIYLGSTGFSLRTRTPPIRTLVEMPISFDVRSEVEFLYQRISEKVKQLTMLGMKQKEIAGSLGVHPKTVRKAIKVQAMEL